MPSNYTAHSATLWYCGHCGQGAYTGVIDSHCAVCGKQRDKYAKITNIFATNSKSPPTKTQDKAPRFPATPISGESGHYNDSWSENLVSKPGLQLSTLADVPFHEPALDSGPVLRNRRADLRTESHASDTAVELENRDSEPNQPAVQHVYETAVRKRKSYRITNGQRNAGNLSSQKILLPVEDSPRPDQRATNPVTIMSDENKPSVEGIGIAVHEGLSEVIDQFRTPSSSLSDRYKADLQTSYTGEEAHVAMMPMGSREGNGVVELESALLTTDGEGRSRITSLRVFMNLQPLIGSTAEGLRTAFCEVRGYWNKLCRPQLRPGYRRIEWICVSTFFPYPRPT